MSFFDLTLVIILGGFVLYGLWFGLIHAFGALVGVIVGAFVAGRLFEPLAESFSWMFGGNVNLGRIVIFFVLFVLVNRLVGFGFYLIERAFKIVSIIPFLKSINRLAGAALGFIEGSLVLGGALMLMQKFPLSDALTLAASESAIAAYLLGIATVIIPLLPDLLRKIETVLPERVF
ncbi:MAG: CvpA family protein [Candidatus Uhrbacteria bacterium]